ncbi:hypothetical protein FB107DRAFT_280383 [Schizophyllum commune]
MALAYYLLLLVENGTAPVILNDPAHADEVRENAGGVPEEQARGEPAKQADNAEVENATETVDAHATDAPKASNDRDVTHAAEPENLPTTRIEDGHASNVVGQAPDFSTHTEGLHGVSKETAIHAHEPQATDMLKGQATEALNAEATVAFNVKSANDQAGDIDDALTRDNATPTATEPPGDGEDATKRVNEQIPDEHNEAATYRTSRQAHDVPDVEDAEARSVEAKELIVAQVGESRPSHAAALAPLAAHEKQVGQVLGEQAHNEHEEKEVGDASDDQAVAQKAGNLPAAQVDVGRPLNTATLMGPTLPPVAKQAVDANKSDQYDNAPDAQVVNALSATSADQSAGAAEDAQAEAIAAPATSNNLAPDAHATQAQEERHNGALKEQSGNALPMKTVNQGAEPVDNNQAAQTASSARQEPLARHEEAKDALKDEAEDALKGHTTDNDRLIEPATVKAEDLPTAQARDERPPIVAVPVMSAGHAQVIVHAPATTDNSAAPDGRTMRAAVSAIPEHEVLARTFLRAPLPVVPSARDVFYMPEPAFPREADIFFAPRPYHKLAQPPVLPHPPMLPVVQPPTITRSAGMNNLRPDLGRAGEDGGRAQEADLGRPNERVQQIQNADPVGTREGQRLAILAQAEAETIAALDNALVPDVDPAQADAQARLDVAAPADAPIEDDVEVGQPGEALDVPDHAMEGDMPEPAAARGMDQKLADGDATNVDHHEVAEVHVDVPVHDDDAVADQGDVEPHNDGTAMPEVNGDAKERADAAADEGPPNVAAEPTGTVQDISNAALAIATPITVPPPAPAKDVAPVPAEAPVPAPVNDAQAIDPAPVEVQPRAPTEAATPVAVAVAALPPPRDATPGGAEVPAPAPAQALRPREAEQIHAPPATCEESVPKAFKRSTYTKRTLPTPIYNPAQADLLHDPAYGPLLKHISDADAAHANAGGVGGSPDIVNEAPKVAGTLAGDTTQTAKIIVKHEVDEGVKGADGQITATSIAFVPCGPVDPPQDAATAGLDGNAQTASDVDLPIASGSASSSSMASTSALPGPSSAASKARSGNPFAGTEVDAHDAPPTYSGKGKGKAVAWSEEDARLPWHLVGVTPSAISRMMNDGWPKDPDLARSPAVDDVGAPLQPQIRKSQHTDSTPPVAGPSRWASMQDLNAGPESSLQRSLSVGNQENRLPGFAVPLVQERARTKTAFTRPVKAARPARNAAPTRTAEPATTANPATTAAPAKPTNPATTANPTRPTQAARHADDGRAPKGAGRPSGDGRAARGTGRPADDGRAARGMGRPVSNGQRQTGKKRR